METREIKKQNIKKWYLRERHNPQIAYYVVEGELSQRQAKLKEKCAYGENVMLAYDTVGAMELAITKFKLQGFNIY